MGTVCRPAPRPDCGGSVTSAGIVVGDDDAVALGVGAALSAEAGAVAGVGDAVPTSVVVRAARTRKPTPIAPATATSAKVATAIRRPLRVAEDEPSVVAGGALITCAATPDGGGADASLAVVRGPLADGEALDLGLEAGQQKAGLQKVGLRPMPDDQVSPDVQFNRRWWQGRLGAYGLQAVQGQVRTFVPTP